MMSSMPSERTAEVDTCKLKIHIAYQNCYSQIILLALPWDCVYAPSGVNTYPPELPALEDAVQRRLPIGKQVTKSM